MTSGNFHSARLRRVITGGSTLVVFGLSGIAFGQANLADFSEQRLDRVDVIHATGADNIYVDTTKSAKPWDQKQYTATGSNLSVCQNTGTRGLYCLDGNKIVNWANPESQVAGTELFNCGNKAVFAFDNDNVCTAMAVDLAGNVWIAGKKKSKFSLFKVTERASATCPNDYPAALPGPVAFTGVDGKPYCAREYAAGRPLLVDLTVIDGDTAEGFPYSEGGVIGVEERKEVTFFRDVPKATPWVVGAGRAWGLTSGEQLQGASMLQRYFPADLNNSLELTRNWILVTTSKGRLLSREMPTTAGAANTKPVLNHSGTTPVQVNLIAPAACGPGSVYDVRTSVKTRAVFVSDQRGCRVLSLKSNVESVSRTGALAFVLSSQETVASTTASPSDSDALAQLTTFPQSISIAPGVEVNLRDDCSGTDPLTGNPKACPIVGDGGDAGNVPAAQLKNVTIDTGTPAGLTVFQIQNIADCRYLNFSDQPAECKNGAILAADGRKIDNPADLTEYTAGGMPLNPESLFLNVTPLLPPEVTKIKPLPAMLISPRYKALASRRTFDAVFGVSDAGVRFRGNFQADFFLDDLLGPGVKLGCGGEDPLNTLISENDGPKWDILLTISENFTTVGGLTAPGLPNGGRQHTDMLVNKPGCDPQDPPGAGTRWSMYAYALQMAEEKVPNRTNPAVIETRYSDSILAKLTLSLFKDLGETIDTYACVDRDGGTGAPISATACSNLQANWFNTNDKLTKCVESSTQPLNSTEIRACNAFEVQYQPFKALVDGLMKSSTASDPANRVGEVKARLEVFRYVYDSQFKPSIPPNTGFEDPLTN